MEPPVLMGYFNRYWDELSTDISCPIHFTAEELQDHAKDGQGWNDVQEFWDSVSSLVARDGWTSLDNYAQARLLFTELRDNGLKTLEGEERDAFERETRWAQPSLGDKADKKHPSSLCG